MTSGFSGAGENYYDYTDNEPRDEGIFKVRLVLGAAKSKLPGSLPHCVSLVGLESCIGYCFCYLHRGLFVRYVKSKC